MSFFKECKWIRQYFYFLLMLIVIELIIGLLADFFFPLFITIFIGAFQFLSCLDFDNE